MPGMNYSLCAVVAAVLGYGASAGSGEILTEPVEGKIEWVYSLEEGKQLAHRTGKPLFVVFRCER